jgi:hypothetical protein
MKNLNETRAIKIFLPFFILFSVSTAKAQVGIGTTTPAASAQLDLSSTKKGFLPPRMTRIQRDSIDSPAEGLLIYQLDSIAGMYCYSLGSWKLLSENINGKKSIPVLITQDDFSSGDLKNFWKIFLAGNGAIEKNTNGTIALATGGTKFTSPNIAELYSTNQKSVNEGTLVFTAVVWTYRDPATDGVLARGLVSGTDRNNAIEFINIDGTTIQARTVSGGSATVTNFSVGASVSNFYSYTIIASKSKVEFFLDGVLIATHTTNIPSVLLNMYFDASTGLIGSNIPHVIDFAKFEIVP